MDLRAQLSSILSHSEECWSQLLLSHGEDSEKFKEQLVLVASEMRARMQKAISCSSSLFETNMQCLVHIMCLRRENSQLVASHEAELKVM